MIISYNKLKQDCIKLSKKINKDYDLILLITKGGLIPGYILANELKIKSVETLNINSYQGIDKKGQVFDFTKLQKDFSKLNVLLFDDLVDTGDTIKFIKNKYKFKKLEIATLYHKEGSSIIPDYYVQGNINKNTWITFFYEG